MTREEIVQAIENGESVWACRNNIVYKVALDSSWVYIENDILKWYSPVNKILGHKYYSINELYKTKAEAEHYLQHANITRIETLPFLTWEEFLEKKAIKFTSKSMEEHKLCILTDQSKRKSIGITFIQNGKFMQVWYKYELTEANFYKAYDECVRLFRGGE